VCLVYTLSPQAKILLAEVASFSPEITLQDIQKSAQHANLGLARFLLVARLAVTKHTVRDMPSAPLNEHPAAAAASPNPDLETAAQPAVAASRNPQASTDGGGGQSGT
jgi:hypothetical protein